MKSLRCELLSGPLEGECISGLSFPDASGSTPAKSTRGEFSPPLGSGFHHLCVLLLVFGPRQQKAAQSSLKSCLDRRCGRVVCCWGGKQDAVIPTLCFGRAKSVQATKTPSYVMTNTRRWEQEGGREDWHRRAVCGDFTETETRADAARTVCASIRLIILLSPHTLHRRKAA